MKSIVILGAGTGGALVANRLARDLSDKVKSGEVAITVLDGARFHEFQPDYLSIAFRGARPKSIRRPIRELILRQVHFVNENCSKIDLDNRFVVAEKSNRQVGFDYIIFALGCMPDPGQIPGLTETNLDFHTSAEASSILYERLSRFSGGKILTGIAGLPYKCPPSPNESTFLIHEFFTKKRIRDRVHLSFLTPYLRPYPAEPISEVIEPLYKERKIETLLGFNVDRVEPAEKKVYSMEGESVGYDELFLVPPHTTPRVIRHTEFSDGDGWIITDKRDLHVKNYRNAFAIGDNTNLPISKAGVESHLEGIVVAKNIAAEIRGSSERYLFTGRFQCSMETGFHQATFVIGTYTKQVQKIHPSFINYVKKKIMSKIYWRAELGQLEWLFKLNFGEDYYEMMQKGITAASAEHLVR